MSEGVHKAGERVEGGGEGLGRGVGRLAQLGAGGVGGPRWGDPPGVADGLGDELGMEFLDVIVYAPHLSVWRILRLVGQAEAGG